MNNFGIREQALTEIKQIAEECGIERVLLFGSRARGDHKTASDIDLAVKGGDVVLTGLVTYYSLLSGCR